MLAPIPLRPSTPHALQLSVHNQLVLVMKLIVAAYVVALQVVGGNPHGDPSVTLYVGGEGGPPGLGGAGAVSGESTTDCNKALAPVAFLVSGRHAQSGCAAR